MGNHKKRLRNQIVCSLLVAGTIGFVGVAGNAQAADPVDVIGTTGTSSYYHNHIPNTPTSTYGNIMNNTQTSSLYSIADGGGVYLEAYLDKTAMQTVKPDVTFTGTISGNSVNAKTFRTEGGAVFTKGANSTFIDTPITDNKAISDDFAHGGAIATHYSGGTWRYTNISYLVPATVTFQVTENKNIAYTGNDIVVPEADYNNFDDYLDVAIAPSGGGFLQVYAYDTATFDVADGATLTIGNETPATATEDSISSAIVTDGRDIPDPAIIKTGAGTLTINSSLSRYYGTFTQKAGTVNLNQNLNLSNKYDLQAGTLNLKDVTVNDLYDKLAAENIARPETVTKSEDGKTLNVSIHFDYFNSNYSHTLVNSTGNLITAAGTTVNAQNVTLKDGGSINAEGTLNITGDLSADASTVTANNATVGGTVSSTGGSTVTLGGDSLALSKVNVDTDSSVTLNSGTLTATKLSDTVTGGGKVTLDGTATLATTADQVFTNSDTTATTADDTNALTDTAKNSVTFKAGTLSLNNDYSYAYLTNIQGVMDGLDDSTTSLVMTGNLVDTTGVTNSISVANASAIGSNAALDTVTAGTDNQNLVIGGTSTAADTTTVAQGFSVAALDLGTADSVTVTGGQSLTLGGSGTTDVITQSEDATQPATVALTDGSSLTIGNSAVSADQTLNVNASVDATNSTVTTNGQTTVTGDVSLTDSTIQANTGTLTLAKDLTTAGTSTITGDVAVAGNITGDENTTLNVGTDNTAATISAKSVDLGGGTLYLDPVWQNGDEIGDGSKAAVQTVSDAKLVVGNNSTLTLGSADTSIAEKAFADTGLSWGSDGILSALYVNSSQDLTNNSIVVDSSATATSGADYGTFTMGNNSLLMVNGSAVSGSQAAALTNVSSTNISSSAKLYIDGATKDTTYNILSASAATATAEDATDASSTSGDVKTNNAWYADADANTTNVLAHNQLLKFVGADGNGTSQFSVKAVTQDASDVYGNKIVDAAVVTKAIAGSGAAADFFNNAANDEVNATNDQQANAINSAAALTELAGVQHGLYTANNLFDSAVMNHLADGTQDKDIWAHYIHSKEDIDNLGLTGLNGASYEAQYNGVIVGSDFYATKNAVAGAAFTYMDGSIDGSTATAYTKNDADYYGLSLYGRLSQGKTNYLGDISWLHGKNDLTQYNSLTELTGSVSSNAFSAGVRAEQNYKAGIGTLTPYVGLRYAHLDFGDYTDSIGVHHDADTANLWLVPVGLRYSLTSQHGNWNIKPIAEAGYLWTMGDRNGTETVSLDGTANAFGFDLADSGTYYGRLGVEAEKGNLTYGLGYQYQKGDTVRSNTWMGAVRYKF